MLLFVFSPVLHGKKAKYALVLKKKKSKKKKKKKKKNF